MASLSFESISAMFESSYVDIDEARNTSNGENIEQAMIVNDAFAHLSREAKEVISTVLECPTEFELFIRQTGRDSIRNVRRFLRKEKHWKYDTINETLREVRAFVGEYLQ